MISRPLTDQERECALSHCGAIQYGEGCVYTVSALALGVIVGGIAALVGFLADASALLTSVCGLSIALTVAAFARITFRRGETKMIASIQARKKLIRMEVDDDLVLEYSGKLIDASLVSKRFDYPDKRIRFENGDEIVLPASDLIECEVKKDVRIVVLPMSQLIVSVDVE